MGVCILGMGDCGSKTDNKSITNITNINKTMTNMVSSTSQTVKVTQINTQNMEVEVLAPPGYNASTWGPLIKGCSFKNNQTMNATQKVSVTLDLTSTKNLQTQIASSLKAENSNAVKQKTDFLQTASTSANNYTEVNQVIDNLVSTNIDDSVKNDLSQLMQNAQSNKLHIYGPVDCGGKALSENVQQMLVTQISDTLTKALTGTTVSAALKADASASNKNVTDQEGGGLGSLMTSFFKGLGGLMTGPLMIIALIIVVALVGVFIFRKTLSKIAESKSGVSFGKRFGLHFGRKRLRTRR